MIQFKKNARTDGRKDRKTLFYRTLPATVEVPITKLQLFFKEFSIQRLTNSIVNFHYIKTFSIDTILNICFGNVRRLGMPFRSMHFYLCSRKNNKKSAQKDGLLIYILRLQKILAQTHN